MSLPVDTKCTRCGRTIAGHLLRGSKAMCDPQPADDHSSLSRAGAMPSPNLQAPEVLAMCRALGHKPSYDLVRQARQVEYEREQLGGDT